MLSKVRAPHILFAWSLIAASTVIPKENVTYTFSLPLESADSEPMKDLRFDLHGGNFAFRGSDRASKKFKAKGTKGFDF